jgi:hypothetical protein
VWQSFCWIFDLTEQALPVKLTNMTFIPSHYRLLKPTEVLKEGDIYTSAKNPGNVQKVKNCIGMTSSYWSGAYLFYRRRHVKIKNELGIFTVTTKKPKAVVKFSYKNKVRRVQVIKFTDHNLFGLEIIQPDGKDAQHKKPTYKFKNFLRDRMQSQPVLEQFGV